MENISPEKLRTQRWDLSDPKSVHIRVLTLMLWEKGFNHREGWVGSTTNNSPAYVTKLSHPSALAGVASGVSPVPLSTHDANRHRSFSQ